MFKFDFDLAEEELDEEVVAQTTAGASTDSEKACNKAAQQPLQAFAEHSLSDIVRPIINLQYPSTDPSHRIP